MTRPPRTTRLSAIDDATASEIRALLALAEDADGVEAVSESFRLAIGPAREGVVHLVRLDEDDAVVGYAQVAQAGGPDAVAELVVDPRHRRRGHGRALLDEVVALGARSVWAHGMLPAATALAAAAGLVVTRELYVMGRPLTAEDAVDPALPQGFSVRPFEPGVDDEHWVALNAAAFASHPEQGRLTLTDLHERMAQPWFDPAGLLLVVDDTTGDVVAFHWTKVEPTTPPAIPRGEVYVVGVDPAYQGRGLGGPVTSLGLAHLARLGLAEVELYVDGDNTAARRTYTRLGFRDTAVHAQYGTQPGTPSADAPSADLTEPDRIAP
ncbi:MAG TPA: mycothiol synthase [Ornithinibacter sp.]|nr:mycothiol synthase [Ornithinibacter sp.]